MALRRVFVVAVLLLIAAPGAAAARLALRHFSSADGLSRDEARRVVFDAEGFLWIGTAGGLSRFDGRRFVSFGREDGLTGGAVDDVLFAGDGTGWLATAEGLFRFHPAAPSVEARFGRVALDEGAPAAPVRRLAEGGDGTLWVGTDRGLWRVAGRAGEERASRVALHAGGANPADVGRVQALAVDPAGNLWVATHSRGVFRLRPEGAVDHLPPEVRGAYFVRDFWFGEGEVCVAVFGALVCFVGDPFSAVDPAAGAPRSRVVTVGDGLAGDDLSSLLGLADGRLLVGSSSGVTSLRRSADGGWRVEEVIDRASGLRDAYVVDLAADGASGVWLGLAARGIARLAEQGIVEHDEVESAGLRIVTLLDDPRGSVCGLAASGKASLTLWHAAADRFAAQPLRLPPEVGYLGWGLGRRAVVDRFGTWWVATGGGVARFSDPRGEGPPRLGTVPDALVGMAQGLPGADVQFVATGDDALWIGTDARLADQTGLSRLELKSGRVAVFPRAQFDGSAAPHWLTLDRAGSAWVAFFGGGLFRVDGRGVVPVATEGLPDFGASGMLFDRAGTAWAFGERGLARTDDAQGDVPRLVAYDRSGEVDGEELRCAVEDGDGRIWFGTGRGVLRLDPASGRTRRFTVEDGLPGNAIELCHRDGSGQLWFSDLVGLARVTPQQDHAAPPPEARVRAVHVAGESVPLALNGAPLVTVSEAPAGRVGLEVEFFAIDLGPGSELRFQFMLEGLDRAWGAPSVGRVARYASLPAGDYRFLVRAVDAEGRVGPPAAVVLAVPVPWWLRSEFLIAVGLLVLGAVYAAYRLRLSRLLELERIRTRIATDLHDEVGSGLSQIAVLAQVAARDRGTAGLAAPAGGTLPRITALAGELVGAMSDVVWAINPRADRLSDMLSRLRRFAVELFGDHPAELELELDAGADEPLDPTTRRALYLVFKEALHNAARHSGARHVRACLRREGRFWSLRVTDDGRGLPVPPPAGQGLDSMRRRARELGEELTIVCPPGGGTEISLRVPRRGGATTLFKRIVFRRRGGG